MSRPTTDTALLAYLDAHGTDGPIPEGATPGVYAVRLMDRRGEIDLVLLDASGEIDVGGCSARRWDVLRYVGPLELVLPGAMAEAEKAGVRYANLRAALSVAFAPRCRRCPVADVTTDIRSHLDAHGTNGAPPAPGWYIVALAFDVAVVRARYEPVDGARALVVTDPWTGATMLASGIARHAPLHLAAPGEVARLTAERDAAVARAERAERDAKMAEEQVRRWRDLEYVAGVRADRNLRALRARVVDAMAPHLRHMIEGGAVNGGDMLRDVCEATGVDYGDIRRAAEVDP